MALTREELAMVDVKICGLSEPTTLEASLDRGAAYIGFNFYEPSPRYVTCARAGELGARIEGRAVKVAVTVDADDALLEQIMTSLAPDYVQVQGSETAERVRTIAATFDVAVIKSIKVRDADDIADAIVFDDIADMLHYDAKAPADAANALPGGNGVAFDWRLLRDRAAQRPFMLSGGLDADNVEQAIRMTGAPIVDVSSGVERAPGVKDAALIAKFIEAVRRAG